MPDNLQVNNIVLKFHYYKPREQYKEGDDNIKKEILLVTMEVITMLVMFILVQANNYQMTMNNT